MGYKRVGVSEWVYARNPCGYKRGIQNWENVWRYGIIPYHDNVNNRERNLIAERAERRKNRKYKKCRKREKAVYAGVRKRR